VQSLGSALTLDRFVPPRAVPAAFALQVAVLLVGTSAGSLVAGLLPAGAPLVVAALLAAGAAATLVLRTAGPAVHPAEARPAAAHPAEARPAAVQPAEAGSAAR
jgi:hypothetical protein